jgi:hypothetical protein
MNAPPVGLDGRPLGALVVMSLSQAPVPVFLIRPEKILGGSQ